MNLIMRVWCLLFTICAIGVMISEQKKTSRTRVGSQRINSYSSRLILLDPKKKGLFNHSDVAHIVKASHFDQEFQLGHKIKLLCLAKGKPRPRITWTKDGLEINEHQFMQISESFRGEEDIQSILEIDPARQMDSGTYECQADNIYSLDRRQFKVDF